MFASALLFLAIMIQKSATEDFSYWKSRSNNTALYLVVFFAAVAAVAVFVWLIRRNNQR